MPEFLCDAVEWILGFCGEKTVYSIIVIIAVYIMLKWKFTEVIDSLMYYVPWLQRFLRLLLEQVGVNLDNDIIETESTVQFNEPSERSSADVAINESQMPKNFINIRLKYLNDTLRIVQSSPQESIADFKRRHFEEELSSNKYIRLIFNGKLLSNDEASLNSLAICDKCVVHCVICDQPSRESIENQADEDDSLGFISLPELEVIVDDIEINIDIRRIGCKLLMIIIFCLIITVQIWFIDVHIDKWHVTNTLKVFGNNFKNIVYFFFFILSMFTI